MSFRVSDLYAAKNQKALFGQMYCIDPDVAFKLRSEQLDTEKTDVKEEVLQILHALMQKHPLAKIYKTADQTYKDEIKERAQKCEGVPRFRVNYHHFCQGFYDKTIIIKLILLSNRELQEEVLKDRPGITLIKSSEKRTNEPISKHIAMDWVSDEGTAPTTDGIWINGQDGRVIECEKFSKPNPNICNLLL